MPQLHDVFLFQLSPEKREGTYREIVPNWTWRCATCREHCLHPSLTKSHVLIDMGRHRLVEFSILEPDHTPTFWVDAIGATNWRCSCGHQSHSRGHLVESRARQAHTRHTRSALEEWCRIRIKHEEAVLERAERERQKFARLSPEGQELYLQRELQNLI